MRGGDKWFRALAFTIGEGATETCLVDEIPNPLEEPKAHFPCCAEEDSGAPPITWIYYGGNELVHFNMENGTTSRR